MKTAERDMFHVGPYLMAHEPGPFTAWVLQGNKGYQISHLVKRSTFLYPSLWLNASLGADGMWLPTFWVRSRFQPTADSAKALSNGLSVRPCPFLLQRRVTPAIRTI